MTYHKDFGIDLHVDYNRFGFERRYQLGSERYYPIPLGFDADADECEEFGNNIRRSPHWLPRCIWDKIYKYPTSQHLREFIREAETNGLKSAIGRSPSNHDFTIHEGKFIRWWEKRRNAK